MWVGRENQEERSLQVQVNIEESGQIDLLENNLPMGYYFVGRSNEGYSEHSLEMPKRIGSMILLLVSLENYGADEADVTLYEIDEDCDMSMWPESAETLFDGNFMKCLPGGIAVEGNELTEKHTRPLLFFRTCQEL